MMRSIFLKRNRLALSALPPERALLAFDFDGTLSRIVRDPEGASIAPGTESLLKELSRCASTGVISGRSLRDLRARVKFNPRFLVGNHGIEGVDADLLALGKAREKAAFWMRVLRGAPLGAGVEVEDKSYSLAVHYRRSRNKRLARERILSRVKGLDPRPRVLGGKWVFNLLPEGVPHKGLALLRLMEAHGLDRALYVGDDDTDEDVFGLPEAGEGRILTVRVGRKRSSRARYFIERQEDINKLLKLLLGACRGA